MKKTYYILSLFGLALLGISRADAQTTPKDSLLNRTVVVEQNYNPNIADAKKIDVLPEKNEPKITPKKVVYLTEATPIYSLPKLLMPIYNTKEDSPIIKNGLLKMGYGNYNNLDLFGNYRFNLSEKDKLNFNIAVNGMDGVEYYPQHKTSDHDKAYYYNTEGNINFTHQFKKSLLTIEDDFQYVTTDKIENHISNRFTAGINSIDKEQTIQFNVMNHFIYSERDVDYNNFKNNIRAFILNSKGFVEMRLSNNKKAGIDFDVQHLSFNEDDYIRNEMINKELSNENSAINKNVDSDLIKNHTLLNLAPFYQYQTDAVNFKAGVNLDFSFGHGDAFRISPQLLAEYNINDRYTFYAEAKGQRIATTLDKLLLNSPYAFINKQLKDSYERINARLGFKASPYEGLWINLYGGYQDIKDNLAQDIINNNLAFINYDSNATYAGAKLSYEYKDYFSISAKTEYRKWNKPEEENHYNIDPLSFKPELSLHASSRFRITQKANFNIGYYFIKWNNKDLKNISNLYVQANYQFVKNLSAYVKLDNLLNQEMQYTLDHPAKEFNFIGGIRFQF